MFLVNLGRPWFKRFLLFLNLIAEALSFDYFLETSEKRRYLSNRLGWHLVLSPRQQDWIPAQPVWRYVSLSLRYG